MAAADEALRLFDEGFNCAQSVLASRAPALGIGRAEALRAAAGFGGGMGRLAGTCGAVSGAVIALGFAHGAVSGADAAAKERTYETVRALVAEFRARHGSITCRELLGEDVSTPEGFRRAHDGGLTRRFCPAFVRSAVEILERLG